MEEEVSLLNYYHSSFFLLDDHPAITYSQIGS